MKMMKNQKKKKTEFMFLTIYLLSKFFSFLNHKEKI